MTDYQIIIIVLCTHVDLSSVSSWNLLHKALTEPRQFTTIESLVIEYMALN